LDLCDESGRVCVRMQGLTSRVLEGGAGGPGTETLLLEPVWKEAAFRPNVQAPEFARRLAVICEPGADLAGGSLGEVLGGRCIVLNDAGQAIDRRFTAYAMRVLEEIRSMLNDQSAAAVFLQVVVPADGEGQLLSGLSGLLRTAQLENPKFIGQLIEAEAKDPQAMIRLLEENGRVPADSRIRYSGGIRYVAGLREAEAPDLEGVPWKADGVYLITGGAGELGLVFAKEIAARARGAKLFLTGRSPLDEAKRARIEEVRGLGARVEYRQVDVSDESAGHSLIREVREGFGELNGIVHSAGVVRDSFILNKTHEELQAVFSPKATGLLNLDLATKEMPLDVILAFSSLAGCLGNQGQADYAAANAFMDGYAAYRNGLVKAGKRQGKMQSINWPLWEAGGMGVDAQTAEWMRERTGMTAMGRASGIWALYRAMAAGSDQVLVVEGNRKKLEAVLLGEELQPEPRKAQPALAGAGMENAAGEEMKLRGKTEDYLKRQLAGVIKLPAHRMESEAPMEKYGIDSIMVMQLTNELEKTFGALPKTLFFEYRNIRELAGYFLSAHKERMKELLGEGERETERVAAANEGLASLASPGALPAGRMPGSRRTRGRYTTEPLPAKEPKSEGAQDIAIIGVAGRYPGARNIQEFWTNLQEGKDCITEIPADRWDHSAYFDEEKGKPGKTYSKWGGFLEGVNE
ncbi:beta-ketoacyl reductase, partial [Paenibacillus forsythiae]|uniref:beta-ketoacyl reductase n=1 Tax=Paenibacillus forsythiae TaxID=365616 RepID=UPI00055EEC5C